MEFEIEIVFLSLSVIIRYLNEILYNLFVQMWKIYSVIHILKVEVPPKYVFIRFYQHLTYQNVTPT